LNQTFSDLEIILVDDGSADPITLALLNEYTEKDARIRVIRKENAGQSSARNTGFLAAKGMYVAFVDHDDVLNAHMYEILSGAAAESNVDVVECRYKSLLCVDIGKIDLAVRPKFKCRSIRIEDEKEFLVEHNQIWKRICRRDFLLQNCLEFEHILWGEDVLFSFKVLLSARTLLFIDEVLYFQIEHGTNTTHTLGLKIFDAFKAHDLMYNFLKERQALETFKDQYLGRVLKDVLFSLNAVQDIYEERFFLEAHSRIARIPLKQYKEHYSRSKRQLLGFVQKGDFKAYKRYQTFRRKRKHLLKMLFKIRYNRYEKSITFLGLKWGK
jgi:glycosyltransferase involved in cell wall biosynthesis